MADVFKRHDAYSLLSSKYIAFIGDSNIRAQYKDLIWLLKCDTLIANSALRTKMEKSYMGDTLVKQCELHRGRDFEECRTFKDYSSKIQLDFMFVTRCYDNRIVTFLNDIKGSRRAAPDVIYINSCLWDINRWGPNGVAEYKDNMVKLMKTFKECLPVHTLVLWATALPISTKMNSSLLVKQLEFMKHFMRFEVMEANLFARDVVVNHGYDIVDNHFHMRMQIHRRAKDGVHFQPIPVRFMTNLMLTHLALSWDTPLPGRCATIILGRAVALEVQKDEPGIQLPQLPVELPQVNKNTVSSNITVGTNNSAKKKKKNKRRRRNPLNYNNQMYASQSLGPIKNRQNPRNHRYWNPYY